jgi:hypothetical protein
MEDTIDDEIALRDPEFRWALEVRRSQTAKAGMFGKQTVVMPAAQAKYLEAKRMEWWKSHNSELTVSLNDPTLYSRCKLEEYGIRPLGKK